MKAFLYRLLAWVFVFSSSAIAGTTLTPTTDPSSGISIRIDSWLETCPQAGMVPLKVSINNRGSSGHTWEISVSDGSGVGGSMTTTASITVEAGRIGETTLYALLSAPSGIYRGYHNINISINGPCIRSGYIGGLNTSSGSSSMTEFIGMSKKLSAKGWSPLKANFDNTKRSGSSDLDGCEVDMNAAPDDWRGYTGLAQLWMDESEWLSLREGSKAALLDWLALGGRLFILGNNESDARLDQIKLPPTHGGLLRHGAGRVSFLKWDGKTFPVDEVAKQIRLSENKGIAEPLSHYRESWELVKGLGELSLQHGLIFGFILVFGILIGPINLFVLAPAKNRHRLFWTTPALSVIGSALLVALMVLQDGFGGHGSRVTLGLLLPEQKKMALIQEQVSKTGVLLGRSFAKEEPSWMLPLLLKDDSTYGFRRDTQHRYNESPESRGGDWFASRAIQAQMTQAIRPTRAAIEFFPGADDNTPPSVLSSIEVPLEKVFIIAENNICWTAENVGTGEKKLMTKVDLNALDSWSKNGLIKESGPVIQAAWAGLKGHPGFTYASAKGDSKFSVKSLNSVQWTSDRILFAGPYVKH